MLTRSTPARLALSSGMRLSTPAVMRLLGSAPQKLLKTPLFDLHVKLGAKMVPFAGYEMPVQYEGVLPEHKHTRSAAGFFDVSHMGQLRVTGKDRVAFIEKLVSANVAALPKNATKLSMFTNENGGINDDTMVQNRGDSLFIVVNAACKDKDVAHIQKHMKIAKKAGMNVDLEVITDRALVALQGPKAVAVIQRFVNKDLKEVAFMSGRELSVKGCKRPCLVTRCGYTGEDGFEISVHKDDAVKFTTALLKEPEVKPIGLGARDSLRLESGLCLYGNDMDEKTTPLEASLMWLIPKERRKAGAFVGSDKIMEQVKNKSETHHRVGFIVETGAPAREHSKVFNDKNEEIGMVTSGTFGVSLGKPCEYDKVGTKVFVETRGKKNPAVIAKMPFVKGSFYRGGGFN